MSKKNHETSSKGLKQELTIHRQEKIQELADQYSTTFNCLENHEDLLVGYAITPCSTAIKLLYNKEGLLQKITSYFDGSDLHEKKEKADRYFHETLLHLHLDSGPGYLSTLTQLVGNPNPIAFFVEYGKANNEDVSGLFHPYDFSVAGTMEHGEIIDLIYSFSDIKGYLEAIYQQQVQDEFVWSKIQEASSETGYSPFIFHDL